jgi:hypothetical protein
MSMNRMRAAFLEFHRDNPQVYQRAKEMCQLLWSRGWRHYSMRTVIHALRFRFDVETGGEDVEVAGGDTMRVKLNNNHSPYYARLLSYKEPRFEGFFEYRRVAGEENGVVILFSDVPGEPDFVLGQRSTTPPQRRLRVPPKKQLPRRYR